MIKNCVKYISIEEKSSIFSLSINSFVVVAQSIQHWPPNPDCLRSSPEIESGNTHSLLNGGPGK
jgi:hypothetical protein